MQKYVDSHIYLDASGHLDTAKSVKMGQMQAFLELLENGRLLRKCLAVVSKHSVTVLTLSPTYCLFSVEFKLWPRFETMHPLH